MVDGTMPASRVVVTGIGVVTGNAAKVDEFADTLLHGRTAIRKLTRPSADGWPIAEGAEVDADVLASRFSARQRERLDRDRLVAMCAVEEALVSARLDTGLPRAQCAVVAGCVQYFGRSSIAEHIAEEYGLGRPRLAVDAACSAGAHGVGVAFQLVHSGMAPLALAVGYNTLLHKDVAGLFKLGILTTRGKIMPFDRLRTGTQTGEAAGTLVLERLDHAVARGAPIYGEMLSFGAGADAHQIVPPDLGGSGLAIAMRSAMRRAGISPDEVHYVNAHGTGTKLNDPSETAAIRSAMGDAAYRVPVSSTKPITGHTLGAAGIVEAIAALLATRGDFVPPTLNHETPDPECDLDYVPQRARRRRVDVAISNSSGFGGIYSAIIFRKHASGQPTGRGAL
ncbi:beta-ketoacyl-[acyl-carrier-protein] synthase family protein [Sorangium sp. So ce260]|uniref:beta-ketoacyl-[acyl-carrier-protein] synthase family protein n=1 Tax=Sorangium sp. So ce260 TaxID=3133291 RepID=UPI003F5E28D3